MKLLMAPVGIEKNRILSGISNIKPDKIFLYITKKVEDDFTKKWAEVTKKFAEEITEEIKFFYDKENIRIIRLELGSFQKIFREFLKVVNKESKKSEELDIYIDITSSRRAFETAALTLSMFMKNVTCLYTPPKKPLMPDEYPERVIKDKGKETTEFLTPNLDFSELRKERVWRVLKAISKLGGKTEKMKNILKEVGWEDERANIIMLSKLANKLKNYGCLKTKKVGRRKKIWLTELGKTLAQVPPLTQLSLTQFSKKSSK